MKRPEEALQIAVVAWLRVALPPDWRVHHSPNGGKRGKVEAARFKKMGTSAGFPDLALFGPSGAIFIELKAGRGKLTPEQKAWREHLYYQCGFTAAVATSLAEVQDILTGSGILLRARVTA